MSNSKLVDVKIISPNKTSPRTHKIDTITIHCMAQQFSAKKCGELFQSTARRASSNYGIGPDGKIGLYVEEKDRSWCSSNSANDNRAITIEVASDSTHPYKVTDKAYESLIKLLVDICKRNNIKELKWKGDKSLIGQVSKQNMTVHRWFANKACPGDYLYNKHGSIVKAVNKELEALRRKENSMKKGIDVSEHQVGVNYSAIAKQLDFVIVRSSYGNSNIDKQFLNHVKGFKEAKVPILGVYHFLYTTSVEDAKAEAKFCVECVKKAGLPKSTIIFADFEYDTVDNAKEKGITLGKKECIAHTKAFVEYCEKQGYPVGIYTNIDYHNRMYDKSLLDKYIYWLADYSGNPDFPCELHQYSSKGKLKGYSSNLDMNNMVANTFKPSDKSSYKVTTSAALRKSASITATKLATLKKGTVVNCTGFSSKSSAGNKWLYVSVTIGGKNVEGFVVAKKLTKISNTSIPSYVVGSYYKTQAELQVYKGPSVDSGKKKYSELTASGKANDSDKDGALNKGTTVVCKQLKQDGKDIWFRCPSGWLKAYYNGKVLIK